MAELNQPTPPILSFGQGWHQLERNGYNYGIWTMGRGELILPSGWSQLKLTFTYPSEDGKLTVIGSPDSSQLFDVVFGNNTIVVDIVGLDSITIISPTIQPSTKYRSLDSRWLGIRLLEGISLMTNGTEQYVSLKEVDAHGRNDSKQNIHSVKVLKALPENEHGNIDMTSQIYHSHHRSGWKYVLDALLPYNKSGGILFDGFIENSFGWNRRGHFETGVIPYTRPWVGVTHNPPNTPSWFSPEASPGVLLASGEFEASLKHCMGLYALSQYHAAFLKCYIKNVPIEVLTHPTAVPSKMFSFDAFVANSDRKILNIGFWLRVASSIYKLQVDPKCYKKMRLFHDSEAIERILQIEQALTSVITPQQLQSVTDIFYLPNDGYDELLSKNVVFVHLYDSSANNVVVECIARATPILINPLPAIVEYLGAGYPLYFNTLEEAEAKLKNFSLIEQAHRYLLYSGRQKNVTIESFLQTLRGGAIWKSLL